eukprot:8181814-Pyramimonas_sp.AAC.1
MEVTKAALLEGLSELFDIANVRKEHIDIIGGDTPSRKFALHCPGAEAGVLRARALARAQRGGTGAWRKFHAMGVDGYEASISIGPDRNAKQKRREWLRSCQEALPMTNQSWLGTRKHAQNTHWTKKQSIKPSTTCLRKWTQHHGLAPDAKWRPWDLGPGDQEIQIFSWSAAAFICRKPSKRRAHVAGLAALMKH